jgi:ribosomal-protein-serine acetyltransferase
MSTPSVSIRPYAIADVPALYEAVIESRAELAPWMPWCHPEYLIDDSRSWVELQIANFREAKELDFVIESPEGRFLGGCGLNQFDLPNGRANLGYWLRSSATGRGHAAEAVRQLVTWAFDNTAFIRLEIIAAVGNLKSQRVAERAGAVREGVLRSRLVLHDVAHDAVMYSFVRQLDRTSPEGGR